MKLLSLLIFILFLVLNIYAHEPLAHFNAPGIGSDADTFIVNSDGSSHTDTVVNLGRIASHVPGGDGSLRLWQYNEDYILSEMYTIASPDHTDNYGTFGTEIELRGEFLGVGSYLVSRSLVHEGRYYTYNALTGGSISDFNHSPHTAQYFGVDSVVGEDFLCVLESGNFDGWNTEGGINLYSFNSSTNDASFVEHYNFRYLSPEGGIASGAMVNNAGELMVAQHLESGRRIMSVYAVDYNESAPSGITLLHQNELPTFDGTYHRDVIDFRENRAVVSDPFFDDYGRVHVYSYNSQAGFGSRFEILEENPSETPRFGQSVKLYNDNILFISSPYHLSQGCVYVYDTSDLNSIELISTISPPVGSNLTRFGSSLYIDSGNLAITSGHDDLLIYEISSILDADGDGVRNNLDAFPNDPLEWEDTDGDKVGNNSDIDDDNDGIADKYDTSPLVYTISNTSIPSSLSGYVEVYFSDSDSNVNGIWYGAGDTSAISIHNDGVNKYRGEVNYLWDSHNLTSTVSTGIFRTNFKDKTNDTFFVFTFVYQTYDQNEDYSGNGFFYDGLIDLDNNGVADGLQISSGASFPDSSSTLDLSNIYNLAVSSFIPIEALDYTANEKYSLSELQDFRPGSTLIEVSNDQAVIDLIMQESSDLKIWENVGDPALITIPVPADSDTKFYRFKMTD